MKSGSSSSYRAALSGTGADMGGERDDPPYEVECKTCLGSGRVEDADTNQMRKCLDCSGRGKVPPAPADDLTEKFYLVRDQRNKLLWACQKALAAFDKALLSNGVGSTWSGKDVDEMKAAVAACSSEETNADLEEIDSNALLALGFSGVNDEPDVDVYDRQAGVGIGGPIVRVAIRYSRGEQVASHLMLCWTYQFNSGPGRTTLSFEISDYPTRGEVRRLCEALGIEPKK